MTDRPTRPLRIVALVKQIPKFQEMQLGADGRLVRDGLELHMNDYCRRGVRAGCNLAEATGGTCTAITLGPNSADSILREAILCGCVDGIHVTDPVFAGSDTLATARALVAALESTGPWDLVLCGRNSVDADTGQVPAQVAELLDLPLLVGARELVLRTTSNESTGLSALLEHDDEWLRVEADLPAVVSCAERLCDPCKVKEPEAWATVDAERIHRLGPADLGDGPWGAAASPTMVGKVRGFDVNRSGECLDGATPVHLDRVAEVVRSRGALTPTGPALTDDVATTEVSRPSGSGNGGDVVVVGEPGRARTTAELLGAAAGLAESLGGRAILTIDAVEDWEAVSGQGADRVIRHANVTGAAEVARMLASHFTKTPPWAVLAPSTAWGREVAARLAAGLGSGLTGDAVGLEIRDSRLVALKPAFGGRLVAEITCTSSTQLATVRAGVLPLARPRPIGPFGADRLVPPGDEPLVRVLERWRDDDSDLLATAPVVVSIGQGVNPTDLPEIRRLAGLLGAELCATRKVTDAGWLPRARQVGITGHAIAPRLCIAIGTSGKFNHTVGLQGAGTVVGINPDPDCELWAWCDVGMVADWRDAFEPLVERLTRS
ncbi:MAG: FAD-binding protein [Acidimicrobiales bacterium]|nr:FAD-binding protein [Acidimicrobiales bacterium]